MNSREIASKYQKTEKAYVGTKYYPEAPIFRNIKRASDSYGSVSLRELFYTAYEKSVKTEIPQLIYIIGSTGVGKTPLCSQMLRVAEFNDQIKAWRLERNWRPLNFQKHLQLVTHEDAQMIGKELGRIPKDHKAGSYTVEDYREDSRILQNGIQNILKPRTLTFVEAAGLVKRGDEALRNIFTRSSIFEGLDYDAYCVFLTGSLDIVRDSYITRKNFERFSDSRKKMRYLQNSIGLEVDWEPGMQYDISGGDLVGITTYLLDESNYFYNLQERSGVTAPNLLLNGPLACFWDLNKKVNFQERAFAPWLFGQDLANDGLGVDCKKVFVGRSKKFFYLQTETTIKNVLYQKTLEEYNILRRFIRQKRLGWADTKHL